MNGTITQELDRAVARQGNGYRWHGLHRRAVNHGPAGLAGVAFSAALLAAIIVPGNAPAGDVTAAPETPEPPASEPEPDHTSPAEPDVVEEVEARQARPTPASRHRRDDPLPHPPLAPRRTYPRFPVPAPPVPVPTPEPTPSTGEPATPEPTPTETPEPTPTPTPETPQDVCKRPGHGLHQRTRPEARTAKPDVPDAPPDRTTEPPAPTTMIEEAPGVEGQDRAAVEAEDPFAVRA